MPCSQASAEAADQSTPTAFQAGHPGSIPVAAQESLSAAAASSGCPAGRSPADVLLYGIHGTINMIIVQMVGFARQTPAPNTDALAPSNRTLLAPPRDAPPASLRPRLDKFTGACVPPKRGHDPRRYVALDAVAADGGDGPSELAVRRDCGPHMCCHVVVLCGIAPEVTAGEHMIARIWRGWAPLASDHSNRARCLLA